MADGLVQCVEKGGWYPTATINSPALRVLADCESMKKILTVAYPWELEELTHEEIARIIKKNIWP